jgi:hypothetical protein
MQRVGYRAAQQAIEQPGVANTLVDNLRQLRTTADQTGLQLGQFVEPVQLQVVCYQLWEDSVILKCFRHAARRALKRPTKVDGSPLKQAGEPFSSGFHLE